MRQPSVRLQEYERLVPSALVPPDDPTEARPRTARDWVVDVVIILLAIGVGAAVMSTADDGAAQPLSTSEQAVDIAVGVVAIASLAARRRAPLAVGLLTAIGSAVSGVAAVTAVAALFSLAVHRRAVAVVAVVLANVVAANVFILVRPQQEPWLTSHLITVAVLSAVGAAGMTVRARRQLVWTLEQRASRAEAEQELLAEQSRLAERARIAREMHDVLGHRISLMALHAGGLEVRPDLPPDEVAATAALLRTTARQALEELRAVIGVLREDGSVEAPSAPQPTLGDIRRLVDETRRAGTAVSLELDVAEAEAAPTNGRIAYRVVQEALTNVAKHARGSAVIVAVTGGPSDGLTVRVRNSPAASTGAEPLPSGGVGLIGLRERVELAGGSLLHGVDRRGEFVVEAHLRWA